MDTWIISIVSPTNEWWICVVMTWSCAWTAVKCDRRLLLQCDGPRKMYSDFVETQKSIFILLRVAVNYHYYSLFTYGLQQCYNKFLFCCGLVYKMLCVILHINIITNAAVILPVYTDVLLPSLSHPLLFSNCYITPSSSLHWYTTSLSLPASSVTNSITDPRLRVAAWSQRP